MKDDQALAEAYRLCALPESRLAPADAITRIGKRLGTDAAIEARQTIRKALGADPTVASFRK